MNFHQLAIKWCKVYNVEYLVCDVTTLEKISYQDITKQNCQDENRKGLDGNPNVAYNTMTCRIVETCACL